MEAVGSETLFGLWEIKGLAKDTVRRHATEQARQTTAWKATWEAEAQEPTSVTARPFSNPRPSWARRGRFSLEIGSGGRGKMRLRPSC